MEDKKFSYHYDGEGNLVLKQRLRPDETLAPLWQEGDWAYEWQGNGMLRSVKRPDGEMVSFEYDPLGRRISKTYKDKTTRWVWDGNVPLHEWAEEENVTTWLFEEGSFVPCAKLQNGESYSIITDYLGTPTHAFDCNGAKVWERNLDIYGKIRTGNSIFVPFLYQGQYWDEEIDLCYNRFRYYNPSSETYISQDPIGLAGGNPTIYGYVFDSNIEVDIWGLDCSKAQSNVYKGVREALQILKERGLPRQVRKNILQSFDVRTIKVRLARNNEYGIRFHDNGLKATANGRYLFETFPASRNSLAIKPEWNNMTHIRQWQIKKGTLLFEGAAAPQGNLSGGQIQKFVVDNPVTSLT